MLLIKIHLSMPSVLIQHSWDVNFGLFHYYHSEPLRQQENSYESWFCCCCCFVCIFLFLISFFPFFILFDFTRHYRRVFYWFFFFSGCFSRKATDRFAASLSQFLWSPQIMLVPQQFWITELCDRHSFMFIANCSSICSRKIFRTSPSTCCIYQHFCWFHSSSSPVLL